MATAKRKIFYISGTRADFGLMQTCLQAIQQSPALTLQVIVTGMHLAAEYGHTVDEIVAAGLPIVARVPVDLRQTDGASMATNLGQMLIQFVAVLEQQRPDCLLLLGDRGEMLAGALAGIHLNIPIMHIHGGERSGTVDEPVRHAISKLAHFHCVATTQACERLIKMGEQPAHIWVTGAPGLDGLQDGTQIDRASLCAKMELDSTRPVALLVFHPVLQEAEDAAEQINLLLQILCNHKFQVLALKPNADAGSQRIQQVLAQWHGQSGVKIVTHLARAEFVSWMAAADLMIGNSSAGIIEAATFGIPVVNVGSRQNLRERNANVIDAECKADALNHAIDIASKQQRFPAQNIYGDGHAAPRIVNVLENLSFAASNLVKCNAY